MMMITQIIEHVYRIWKVKTHSMFVGNQFLITQNMA